MHARTRWLLAIPALAMAVGMVTVGPAQATVPPAITAPDQQALADQDEAIDEDGNGLANCLGGVQEASLARMNDLPTPLVENANFVTLGGSVVNFATPMNDADQIMVTFSAEARLRGQPVTYATPVDFLQVRVMLDGVPMMPLNDLTFTTGAGEANATQACKRVPEGAHAVWVEWLLVDQAGASVLEGELDDWTLHIEINN